MISSRLRTSQERSAFTVLGCWITGVLINLAFWGLVIYVAWHFISKFW